jgi:hypothetical protein
VFPRGNQRAWPGFMVVRSVHSAWPGMTLVE